MYPYPADHSAELRARLTKLEERLRQAELVFELALLEDQPLEALEKYRSEIQDLKRKTVLYRQAADIRGPFTGKK